MAFEKQRVMVKIRKGQSFILPGGAKILSLTELDGAQAESLCAEFPPSTPLTNYTFFFERRVFKEIILSSNEINGYIVGYGYDEGEEATWATTDEILNFIIGVGPQPPIYRANDLLKTTSLVQRLKKTDGIIAVYMCDDCNGIHNCNNTITLSIPSSYSTPYFIVMVYNGDIDPYYIKVYPIDPDFPGQIPREECSNRV